MKRFPVVAIGLALIVALALVALHYVRGHRQQAAIEVAAVQRIDQDVQTADVLEQLRTAAIGGRFAIVDTNLIDPVAGNVVSGQTVIVNGQSIEWVGPADHAPSLDGATVIKGTGRFLSPGLTDMHVHTEHMAQHVLRLAAGVTSARDMDGFPWLLRTRDAIESGRMIGATLYVAGSIIADQPLSGYAVVVKTPDEARQIVRDQAACGYSFIKVHNSLAEPLFDAVADEAGRVHLDLVGHVPHDISLLHAIKSGQMRTLEHLKGFLIDQTQLPSDEAYAPALQGSDVWLTPTLYARIGNAYGQDARTLSADPRQRYNPRDRREAWSAEVPAEGSEDARMHDRMVKTDAIVMDRLLPLHPRWLVGTDSAGYPFTIAGFAALDEMVLLHQAGLSNAQVVRAATSEPAVAMRRPAEYGRIAPGMRADLVLLATNPLADVSAYQSSLGVMARGRWYDRAALDTALNEVARIYAEPVLHAIDAAAAKALADAAQDLVKNGYVFEDGQLNAAADGFEESGATAAAITLRKLVAAPASGACMARNPQ